MVEPRRVKNCFVPLILFCLVLTGFFAPPGVEAKGMWSAVSKTRQKDTWYIDQTIAYSKRGVVTSARAVLKFVPGRRSEMREQIRDCLDLEGVNPHDFAYYTALLLLDCTKGTIHFSRITFFDKEDTVIWQEDYDPTQLYRPTPGSSTQDISWYLCLNRPGFIDTLKKKKPFLYFFSEGETSQ